MFVSYSSDVCEAILKHFAGPNTLHIFGLTFVPTHTASLYTA